jgi:dTDP-4-amino-4,6-dideoxygalactose transaminase
MIAQNDRTLGIDSPTAKRGVTDLALFGGRPAFAEKLHVGRPNIGNRERLLARINDMLDRRWLTNRGPFVMEFERRFAELIGAKHCVAMCNGTVALEIAVRALGMKGEVIVPSFTFVATAHCLQWQEITPTFGDINPLTHTLDPERVEQLITPRTTGIIGVHLWGRPCQIDRLTEIARRRNLRLIYDASHAVGCSFRDRMIGTFDDAEVFSFHATKFINTFEGGAIVTNNDTLAETARMMQNFGFAGYDNVVHLGTNGKMSEVSAAMGLTALESIDDFIERNKRSYNLYREWISKTPGLRMVEYDSRDKCNFQYVVLEVDEKTTGISRDTLLAILHKENVIARRYFYPGCHRMEPYRSYYPNAGLLLPETEALCERVLVLPGGAAVEESEILGIRDVLRVALENPREVTQRLAQNP